MGLSDHEKSEINNARNAPEATHRATVPELETMLFTAVPVLDHGFIRVIDYMGNDTAVVQAARVSYGKGTKRVNEDRGLIRYLLRHHHTTPFEMSEIKLHVKLPIFVARQWIRHRTANVNEYSARYSILDKEFYVPEPSQLASQATSNRQGRGETLTGSEAAYILQVLRGDAENAYAHYLEMLNEGHDGNTDPTRQGLARELARMNLPLNFYTQWYWKIDLHNLMNFLRLRADSHAQYEIRAYADVLLGIMQKWVPLTYEAFLEYQLNAVYLSATAAALVRRAISGEKITFESSGLSRREWDELAVTFNF